MTRPIIAAHRRELGNLSLDQAPIQRERSGPSFENDGRAAIAGAVDVHLVPADLDKVSERRWSWLLGQSLNDQGAKNPKNTAGRFHAGSFLHAVFSSQFGRVIGTRPLQRHTEFALRGSKAQARRIAARCARQQPPNQS
jgi:hypothetical protein